MHGYGCVPCTDDLLETLPTWERFITLPSPTPSLALSFSWTFLFNGAPE